METTAFEYLAVLNFKVIKYKLCHYIYVLGEMELAL